MLCVCHTGSECVLVEKEKIPCSMPLNVSSYCDAVCCVDDSISTETFNGVTPLSDEADVATDAVESAGDPDLPRSSREDRCESTSRLACSLSQAVGLNRGRVMVSVSFKS